MNITTVATSEYGKTFLSCILSLLKLGAEPQLGGSVG